MPRALVGVFYDDGIYLALAKSLAEGHGYHLQYLPGAPAAVHYPFGYPVLLAALWTLWPSFPANEPLLRGANAVLMGVAAALITAHLLPRLGTPRWLTALAVVLAATAVPMVAVATVLFSEPLFLVFVAGACWAADAARERGGRRALGLALLAGLLAGAAALTRSIGVTVIGGVVLSLAVARRPREAVAAAIPAALLLLPWQFWSRAHHGAVDPLIASNYGTYGDFLRQGGAGWLSLSSLGEIARPLAAITLPPVPGMLRTLLGLITLVVLVAGFIALTRRAPAAGWMLWCYVAIVAAWPYAPDRFLWGVLPWLAVAFVAGVRWMTDGSWQLAVGSRQLAGGWQLAAGSEQSEAGVPIAANRKLPAILGWLAAASVAAGFGLFQIRGYLAGGPTATQIGISATMNDILPWIRSATDTGAVIAGEDEALIWLYTGRRAVPSYLWRVRGRASESFGADSLHAWLERAGATHLIVTGPGSEAAPTIDALLAARRGYLELVRVWPGQLLAFRIHRGA